MSCLKKKKKCIEPSAFIVARFEPFRTRDWGKRLFNPIYYSRISPFLNLCAAQPVRKLLVEEEGGRSQPENCRHLQRSQKEKEKKNTTMTVWKDPKHQLPNSSVTSDSLELTELQTFSSADLNVSAGKKAELTREEISAYFLAVHEDKIQLQLSAEVLGLATYPKVNFYRLLCCLFNIW